MVRLDEMNCEEAKRIIDRWATTGSVTSPEEKKGLRSVLEHIEGCTTCGSSYGPVAPLLERDLLATEAVASLFAAEATDMTDRVMDRVRVDSGPRLRRFRPAIAAAAVLIALLGFFAFKSIYLDPTIIVEFTLEADSASTVHLVGDFNSWAPDEIEMSYKNGVWTKRIRLRRGEIHTYNFVIDGETWISDPQSLFNVDDGFGGTNSMLKL